MGPEWIFHLRRDMILGVKYSLEDLGHDVTVSGPAIEGDRFNLLIGAYFLESSLLKQITACGAAFAHINTEVIANGMLNFNPKKTDFLGAYLPSLKAGRFIWDGIQENMTEYARYGANAHLYRWSSHPRLREIEHRAEKDLDYYFFGMLSDRRRALLKSLSDAGLRGVADHSCPYFVRNDRIGRAKIQLNLTQDDKYTHVNGLRIGYLADNACCILSEEEHDPNGYLAYAEIIGPETIVDGVRHFAAQNRWRERGQRALEEFSARPMVAMVEELLDRSFAT
jgi:hypothetical protein